MMSGAHTPKQKRFSGTTRVTGLYLKQKNHRVSSYDWQGCMQSHHSIIIYSLPLKTRFLFPRMFRTKLRLQKSGSKRSFSSCASFCKRKRQLDWLPFSRRMRKRKSWWGRSQRASPVVSSPSLTPSLPLRMRLLLAMLSSLRWELLSIFLSEFVWPCRQPLMLSLFLVELCQHKEKVTIFITSISLLIRFTCPVGDYQLIFWPDYRFHRRIQKKCRVLS